MQRVVLNSRPGMYLSVMSVMYVSEQLWSLIIINANGVTKSSNMMLLW